MLRVLAVGACLLVPALSLGANAPATKEVTFDPDIIEGTLETPPLHPVDVRVHGKFDSVIKIRKDFDEKVIRSVSEL